MTCGITVAVATHEVCRMSADRVYMPFQVGKALYPPIEFGVTCDNSRDNISSLNGRYSELTAVLERISEILLDVWLNTKRYPYAEMPIVSPEPVDWMKEGTGFLMAKFVGKKYVKSC